MPSTPHQQADAGPDPTPVALIRSTPVVRGLVCEPIIFIEREPGELTVEAFLENDNRLVGRGPFRPDESGLMLQMAPALSPKHIAQKRAARAQWLDDDDGRPHHGPYVRIAITSKGRMMAGEGAGLRIARLEHDPHSPSLQRLQAARPWWRSADWKRLRERREQDHLVGFYVCDDRLGGERMLILSASSLKAASEAGLIDVSVGDDTFTLQDLTGKTSIIQRLKKYYRALAGWVNELERLVRLGAGIAALTGTLAWLLHTLGLL